MGSLGSFLKCPGERLRRFLLIIGMSGEGDSAKVGWLGERIDAFADLASMRQASVSAGARHESLILQLQVTQCTRGTARTNLKRADFHCDSSYVDPGNDAFDDSATAQATARTPTATNPSKTCIRGANMIRLPSFP